MSYKLDTIVGSGCKLVPDKDREIVDIAIDENKKPATVGQLA
ncbi:hypothetical protein [Pontibacter rugosus]